MAAEIHSSGPNKDSNTALTLDNDTNGTPDRGDEDVGVSVSEGEDDDDDDKPGLTGAADREDRRIESIGDENPQLMAYLGHSDSGNSNAIASSSEDESNSAVVDDLDADLDDSQIEAEEELAIRADFREKGGRSGAPIPGPVSLRRLSQSQHARNQNGADSDDSDSSDAISEASSWGNDFLEDYFDLPNNGQPRTMQSASLNKGSHRSKSDRHYDDNEHTRSRHTEDDNEEDDSGADESHLWQYFFSSDDNANEDDIYNLSNITSRARQRRLSRSKKAHAHNDRENTDGGSTDDDLPLKGRGPLAPSHMAKVQPAGYIPSGDSTDEDDGVPPERKRRRARGSKAIEVLGSNSFSARPPVLGSWKIKGDKNVGIIDGLTTRTLSPPPSHRHPASTSGSNLSPYSHSNRGGHQQASLIGDSPGADFSQSGEDPKDPFEDLNDKDLDALGDFTDFGDSEYKETPTRAEKSQPNDLDTSQLDEEVSDLDLLELDDFINTEALSSDDNEGGHYEFDLVFDPQHSNSNAGGSNGQQQSSNKQFRSPLVSPYLYRNRMSNRNAPVSVFRNRGSPYMSNAAYPADNFSPAPRRLSRRNSHSGHRPHIGRDSYMSPSSNHSRKRSKKSKPSSGSRGFLGQNPDGSGEHDFIGELIEIGAISPLFEIDQ